METTKTENKQKWNQTKIGQKVETRSQKKGGKSKQKRKVLTERGNKRLKQKREKIPNGIGTKEYGKNMFEKKVIPKTAM